MARDLDIRPSQSRPPYRPPQPVQQTVSRKKGRSVTPLVLALVGLAAAGLGVYYWASQPQTATAPTTTTTANKESSSAATDQEKNIFQKKDELVVQVYQSGASQAVVDQTIALLKEKGYTVENLGNSQFEYDKTYIWHTAAYTAKAQEIGALLTGRTVSYKESQNAGLFNLLIYLGKQ